MSLIITIQYFTVDIERLVIVVISAVAKIDLRGAAIAQWIRLRLPSCHPGFESQARHLCFFIYSICAIFVM